MFNNECAHNLLKSFIASIPVLYNEKLLTFNFHCLLHLSSDVKNYGSLETFSAFRFQNYLKTLKRMIKKGNNVASQIYKRNVEQSIHCIRKKQSLSTSLKDKEGVIYVNNFKLSCSYPDNFCLLEVGIVQIIEIFKKQNKTYLKGNVIQNLEPYFELPLQSTRSFIGFIENLTGPIIEFSIVEIKQKILCLKDKDKNKNFFIYLKKIWTDNEK